MALVALREALVDGQLSQDEFDETTYVVIDRRMDAVGALMSVYVSDAYVSGRVEADLDGTVTEVFEAS